MARKNASRAVNRMALPSGITQHSLQSVIEADPVFQSNMQGVTLRASQHKITADQVRSICRDLQTRALYRYCRNQGWPVALVPRLERIVA